MKLTIFKGLFSKKSILNKNKWLLLAIVILICLGLYFYSRKNKENFESATDVVMSKKHTALTVYLADGCEGSDDFLKNIWPNIKTSLIYYDKRSRSGAVRGIDLSLRKVTCEELKNDGTDGRVKKDILCNLSGIFNTNTTTSQLGYPLIQYSYLSQRPNLGNEYALIQSNFDPTKRLILDDTSQLIMVDEKKGSDGKPEAVYTKSKILEWFHREEEMER